MTEHKLDLIQGVNIIFMFGGFKNESILKYFEVYTLNPSRRTESPQLPLS